MKLSTKRIKFFQKMIFTWWSTNKRDLPWRRTRDPYRIMVSEVMLQQTQVSRVLPKYREFIQAFPTVSDLAHARPAAVLRLWKGMGYNRRALYLLRAAKTIVTDHQGKFPVSENELIKLPGLGTYTARAILVFAYRQEVPLVDTNIRQIIIHFFFKDQPQKKSVLEDVARQLVPKGKSWEWHQALMDYAALELRNKQINKYTNKQMKKIPFRESNRFYRGRIIDRLREGKVQQEKLIGECVSLYDKPRSFMRGIIASLLKDGLIECTSHGILRLPNK